MDVHAQSDCGCLCCSLWNEMNRWHVRAGCVSEGRPVYQVTQTMEGTLSVLGELLAHVEVDDAEKAAQFLSQALAMLPERFAHYRGLLEIKHGRRKPQ